MLRDILEGMKWYEPIINIIFPNTYTPQMLQTIPSAPEVPIEKIFALYDYRHPLGKKLVYTLKKHRSLSLSRYIAKEMHEHLLEYIGEQQSYSYFLHPLVIPVPLTKSQKNVRGFNQSSLIAKHLASYQNGTSSDKLVYKNRETSKQALLKSRSQRYQNVRGSFGVNYRRKTLIKDQDIIIVDDLVTTGATIEALRACLKKNGARNIIAITVAH